MSNKLYPTTYPYTVFGEELQVIDNTLVEVYDPQEEKVYKEDLYDLMVDTTFTVCFFYPNNFSHVCPTELEQLHAQHDLLKKNECEVLVISRDSVYAHKKWVEIEPRLKDFSITMISDQDGTLLKPLNLFEDGKAFKRITLITGNRGEIISQEILPANMGRNIDELVRKVQALGYLIENPNSMCPENWNPGKDSITINNDGSNNNSGDKLFY